MANLSCEAFYQLLQSPDDSSPVHPQPGAPTLSASERGQIYPIIDGIVDLRSHSERTEADALSSNEVNLTVLIMTKNEEGSIDALLQQTIHEIKNLKWSYEIVVVDGNSTDETVSKALGYGATVFQQSGPDYSSALKQGLELAKGEWILTLDGDGSHDPGFIPKLISMINQGDFIVGSRWIPGGSHQGSSYRGILSRILNHLFKLILRLPVSDTSSGFRLFQSRIVRDISLRAGSFSILQEILIRALQQGYTVVEVPLIFKERTAGSSKARIIKFAVSYIRTIFVMWLMRNSSYTADYEDSAYDSWNLLQRYWQRARCKRVLGLVALEAQGSRILDIGCGSSRIIQQLPQAVAFDISIGKLRFLRKTNLFRVRGSAEKLPFRDESFDCIIVANLVEGLNNIENIVGHLARVIKPGGRLIFGAIDSDSAAWPLIDFFYRLLIPHGYTDKNVARYTPAVMCQVLQERGFRLECQTSILGTEKIMRFIKVNI